VNIDKYISELLYSHDCVIIPEFGGFVANYSPARIHPTQHTFTPPSKNILFNKNLNNNDGLLANAIATAERIPFADAARGIASYVEECSKTLKSGSKLTIESVGTLYFDIEHNLQFEPDRSVNYLADSFGLATFQSPAIRRDTYNYERSFVDREPIPAPRRKINIRKYVTLAVAAVPIVFAMVWIPLKTDLLKNANYSALNPFSPGEKGQYEARKSPSSIISFDDLTEETADHGSGAYYLTLVPGVGEPIAVAAEPITEPLTEAVAETTAVVQPVVKETAGGEYHVVGGCFSIYDNAERYVSQLRGSNITASIIGQTSTGLHIVSLGDFAGKEEAMTALAQARAHNPNAWLLRK
jgi:hypothetical protein